MSPCADSPSIYEVTAVMSALKPFPASLSFNTHDLSLLRMLQELVETDGRICVGHRLHEAMDPCGQQGIVQADDGSTLVWSVFHWSS